MEQFKIGQIVKSISGRDKNRFYVIFSLEDNFAYIADGKIRKIEKPKKKNIKHLSATKKFEDVEQIENNKSLKKILFELNNKA